VPAPQFQRQVLHLRVPRDQEAFGVEVVEVEALEVQIIIPTIHLLLTPEVSHTDTAASGQQKDGGLVFGAEQDSVLDLGTWRGIKVGKESHCSVDRKEEIVGSAMAIIIGVKPHLDEATRMVVHPLLDMKAQASDQLLGDNENISSRYNRNNDE
jgi:hypothetical protein